ALIVLRLLATQAVTVDQVEQAAAAAVTSTFARTNGCAPPVKPPREAAAPLASLASPAQTNGGEPPAPLLAPATTQATEAATLADSGLTTAEKVYAASGCRWPYGDPRHDDFCFCGAVTKKGPYCEGTASWPAWRDRRPRQTSRHPDGEIRTGRALW